MTGSTESADEPSIRASDADRENAAEVLRSGYSEGRLSRGELDDRISAAYSAARLADLRDLTADLPGGEPVRRSDGRPGAVPLHRMTGLADSGPDRCLLLCLTIACPPVGIVLWIRSARRARRWPAPASDRFIAGPDGLVRR